MQVAPQFGAIIRIQGTREQIDTVLDESLLPACERQGVDPDSLLPISCSVLNDTPDAVELTLTSDADTDLYNSAMTFLDRTRATSLKVASQITDRLMSGVPLATEESNLLEKIRNAVILPGMKVTADLRDHFVRFVDKMQQTRPIQVDTLSEALDEDRFDLRTGLFR